MSRPPLVRVVCERHPGRTVGRVVEKGGRLFYTSERPAPGVVEAFRRGDLRRKEPGRRFPEVRLTDWVGLGDREAAHYTRGGRLPTWCRGCRTSDGWVELETLRRAVIDGVRILSISPTRA